MTLKNSVKICYTQGSCGNTVIRLIEDAPFLSLILKTSVNNFRPALGMSLGTSPGTIKKLKLTVHILHLFWVTKGRFRQAQQEKICLEISAKR